jgi:hypothetical protein
MSLRSTCDPIFQNNYLCHAHRRVFGSFVGVVIVVVAQVVELKVSRM